MMAAPLARLGLTRDSVILPLVVLASVAGYLATEPPPTQWGYAEWLRALSFAAGLVAAQLSTSVLPKGQA